LLDHAADHDIPRLWCAWDEYRKPLAIFRALTVGERAVIERRRDDLTLGCAPFTPAEQDRAIKAIGRMLNGFDPMRRVGEVAAAIGLDGLRHVLAPYPLWAIEEGCLAIRSGQASLDGKRLSDIYPPTDAQVRRVVAETMSWCVEKRDAAVALLAAPISAWKRRRTPPWMRGHRSGAMLSHRTRLRNWNGLQPCWTAERRAPREEHSRLHPVFARARAPAGPRRWPLCGI
jgi:hypothetical protein